MTLGEKMESETHYYREKGKEAESRIIELEAHIANDEELLERILDEVEVVESLLKKLTDLEDEANGRDK